MRVTDFASVLNRYFNDYLINDRGCSPRTIDTYRYAFIQLIEFFEEEKGLKPEKIEVNDISQDNINAFLLGLEKNHNVSVATRNLRLAAFKCFASFLKYERPEYIEESVLIQSIKPKKHLQKDISYLKPDGISLLISQVNQATINGIRDYTMLTLMYTTGIRVSELIEIRGRDISLSSPEAIIIHGKGNKIRHVPILRRISSILKKYLEKTKSMLPQNLDNYIFKNHSGKGFTRQGINYLIAKYAVKAREKNPALIPKDCSPHKIRHSTAMALVDEGVDLITIRDLMGHSSVQTTEVYAKISSARQRAAIEAASKEIVPHEEAIWEQSTDIKQWLKALTSRKIM